MVTIDQLTGSDQRRIELGNQCIWKTKVLKKQFLGSPLTDLEEACLTDCGHHYCNKTPSKNYSKTHAVY